MIANIGTKLSHLVNMNFGVRHYKFVVRNDIDNLSVGLLDALNTRNAKVGYWY